MNAFKRSRAGQSTVELALVLPILLFLTVGILELGGVIFAYNSIARAAREGARYETVDGGSLNTGIGFDRSSPNNCNVVGTYSPTGAHPPSGCPAGSVVGRVVASCPGLDPDRMTVIVESLAASPYTYSRGETIRVTVRYQTTSVLQVFVDPSGALRLGRISYGELSGSAAAQME